ncbi:MAG: hypothetical protein H6657_09360 [Ardenticatenaceae bacterium]|nr:hypothetical protein [Anaerolineales bacterium]MCB8977615.1 hypothetical protein [Ardenticatenaceae bacterium]
MKNLNKHLIFMLIAALLFGAVLTACGGEDPTPTPRVRNNDDNEDQEDPTEEPEPTEEPTATAVPTEEPEPTATPDPSAGFVDFSSDVLGVSLSYPEDWAIEAGEDSGELRLASSEEIITDGQDNIQGAILNFAFFPQEMLGLIGGDELDTTDPVAILTVFVDLFTANSEASDGVQVTVTDTPTAVTINGQDAAQVGADATDAEGDTAAMQLYLILTDSNIAFVAAGAEASEQDQYQPVLDAIVETITLSAPAGSSVENVDINLNGTLLLYGDTVTGAVDATGPAVWGFIGLEGEVVDITVNPEGDFDVVVDVMDDSGNSILPNGPVDASFGMEEVLDLSIPATGNYAIVVSGFGGDTGNYTLSLNEAGTSSIGITGDGAAIAYGDFVSGAVDSANPVASYSFTAAADDVVGMIITPFGDFDAVVDVVDSSGGSLLSRERDASFGTENVIVALPADGVYTVNVYGYEGSTGSFDMQMGFPLTNVVIAAGDTLEADDEGEGHSFPFTALRAGDMVGIYVEPAEDLDVAIQVRQSDQLLDGLGFDPERGFDASIDVEEFVMLVEETGNYSFRILNSQDDFAGNTGDYSVVLFGTPEVIFELAYGDFVDARTNPDGLVDYVISGLAGESMVINVASDDDSIDTVIEILDLDENVLASIDDAFSGEVEELVYTFESDGLVLIRVRDFFGGEGDFVMSVDLQ